MEISLDGTWELRFDDEQEWRPIAVPGCWEALPGVPKDRSGPAWYRARLDLPAELAGRRLWLRFGAVSYDCELFVDGRPAGAHRGMWDAFEVEITGLAAPGDSAELLLRVEKPASLTAGPDSPARPGRFPTRSTLSGFLPYVWGHSVGGIWQSVSLRATGRVAFGAIRVRGDAAGLVTAELTTTAPALVSLELHDPSGALVAASELRADPQAAVALQLPEPRPWSPADPALYTARLRLADGDERLIRFGLRSLRAEGSRITLNGRPIYPRMALSWGWYPDSLHSNPGPERVRADLLRLKALGYNGVKLCLWLPPDYYFDLADELGMLIWVELPMWLPRVTPAFGAQTRAEYERIVRQVRGHPSVILYSLGCELNSEAGAELLGPLYALVKGLADDALVRDNSGSGEAYGGLLDEFADYDDHHFYSEPHLLRGLLDSFSPRWRPARPWLFGEFCDLDTFRDLRRLGAEAPWWARADPRQNPQGARWQYDVVEQGQRLRAAGLWERGAELEQISWRQALLHRKWTLELVRSYAEIGGYVVTGEADTPISTAGMWDDEGRLKFDPGAFRGFNADLALLVGWGRRRAWVAGGDRPAFWDVWGYPAGARVRPHLIASSYGTAPGPADLSWEAAFDGEAPFARGQARADLAPGETRQLAVADFLAPAVAAPRRATLRASLRLGAERAENSWPLWVYPREPWRDVGRLALLDPSGQLDDLRALVAGLTLAGAAGPIPLRPGEGVLIATAWAPEVAAFVAGGGAALLLQAGKGPPGPIPTAAMPFWREAVRLVEPHPAWGDFPHEGWAGLPFWGCAADHALDLRGLDGPAAPILTRLDARTMAVHAYAVELPIGAGRLIVSTLRIAGGQGDQPSGVSRNTAAAYLLRCWVRYLGA